jgi:hypothetical protein
MQEGQFRADVARFEADRLEEEAIAWDIAHPLPSPDVGPVPDEERVQELGPDWFGLEP